MVLQSLLRDGMKIQGALTLIVLALAGEITEKDPGNGVRQVQLSPKVMLETSSPSTGEDRGEGDLILPPHSNSPARGERTLAMHRSTSEIFCRIRARY